jgi:FecR protein
MKSLRQSGWVLAILLVVSVSGMCLFAQNGENAGIPTSLSYPNNQGGPADAGSPSNDPPARVARIQYISGEVSMQPGGVNDWVAANLNRPLTSSDRVWADKDSRVELNVGGGYLRMNSESSLTLTNVGDNTIQAQLDQGVLELTVRHLEPGEIYEIDTPNLAFTVMKSGVYRFDVNPNDDQTWVTVRKGYGEATGRGSAVKVSDGEQVRFTGQNSLQHTAYAAPAPDGFDDWAKVRDKRLDSSQSARYVAPGVIGYEDLDAYGNWQVVPTYGNIWVPRSVPVGWAPYRNGHWAWINPWGWTWVDDAPWGFAPFHYGRWVSYGGYWGWAPGPIIGVGWRPYYAPALVGWIGGAGWGFGVSFGFGFGGGCGWFPLGWGEPFYPWYHGYHGGYVSRNYIRNVNITNTHITNINNVSNNYYHNSLNNEHYANRSVTGAVTAAPKSALASGQNIARVGTVVPRSELGKGQVMRSADVSPNRGALLGGQTPRNTAVPPRSAVNRQAVTNMTPPARQANPVAESHNIPQAPATLGAHNPNTTSDVAGTHNVPRPPERNGSANATSNPGYSAQQGSSHVVPKPPYAGGAAPNSTNAAAHNSSGNYGGNAPQHEATSVTRPAASVPHNQQPNKQNESKPKESKPHEAAKSSPGMASAQAPRPAAGYTYHAAPAYTASSNTGRSASYGGNTRSYAASASPYGSSRSSYSAPAQANRSAGTYSAAPSYSARASAPVAPHYSAPPAPHYSGGGGSGGGGHYSGGGSSGGSHASSGQGGHNR